MTETASEKNLKPRVLETPRRITEKPEVFAIYFPNYHRYPHNDAWYGEGWTEWELVKRTEPRFEGHHQPKMPSWGYFNEADPKWAAREIDLAADHGITGFLVDWYWYNGVQLMQEQLEQGFLCAPNRDRLKFALMWANHSWRDNFPAAVDKTSEQMNCWLPAQHSLADMERVADYCVEHYFFQPNYWKIEGKPYFSFFAFDALKQELGGIQGIRQGLEAFNVRVCAAGFPGVYFGVNVGSFGGLGMAWDAGGVALAKTAGFDSVFGYGIARTKNSANTPLNLPIMEYRDVMEAHEHLWRASDGKGLAFFPTVQRGYDCSSRWHPQQKLPVPSLEYPYEPIIVNNTPELYGELCAKACAFLEKSPSQPKILFLNAWNEWTEGSYLLPDTQYGDAYLRALKESLDAIRCD